MCIGNSQFPYTLGADSYTNYSGLGWNSSNMISSIFPMMSGCMSGMYNYGNSYCNNNNAMWWMMGLQCLNFVGSLVTGAVASSRSEQTEAETLETGLAEIEANITESSKELKQVQSSIETLNNIINTLNANIAQCDTIIKDSSKPETEKSAATTAKANYTTQLNEKQEDLAEYQAREEELELEIQGFEAEEARQRQAIDDITLEEASGTRRGRQRGVIDVSNISQGCTNFSTDNVSYLINQFMNISDNSVDIDTKRLYAQALANLDVTTFVNIANPTQIRAREIAIAWLEANPA